MKSSAVRGRGFGGVLRYGLDGKNHENPRILCGNMDGKNARELVREFRAVTNQNSRATQPVWHSWLRLPESDAGKLNDYQWREIVESHLVNVGLDPDSRPWMALSHDGHVHIVSTPVGFDGRVADMGFYKLAAMRSAAKIEIDFKHFGLTETPGLENRLGKIKFTKPEKEMMKRLKSEGINTTHPKYLIIRAIKQTINNMNDNRTNLDFADELLKNGVKFYPSYNSKGNFNGSSFELAEHVENFDANRFMGSQLSNTLKKDKLLAILEKYEQRRMENLENARINEQIGKSIGKIRESLERTKRVSGKIRELTDASEHRNICSAGLISREYDRFTEESKHISESIGIVCGEFEKLNRTRDKFIEQIEVVNEFIRTRNKERTRRFRNSIAKIRNECPSIEEKLHRLDCQSAIAWLFDTKYRLGYIVKRFDESVKQLGKAAGRINNNVNELFKVIKAVNFKYKYIKSGEKLRGTLTKYFDFNDRKHGILQTQEGSPRYFPVDNEPKFVVGKEYNVAREGNNYYVTPLEPKKKIEVQAQRVDKPKFKNEM